MAASEHFIALTSTVLEEVSKPVGVISVTFDPEEGPVRLTRDNTTLYTFWGEMAIYDHVFIADSPTDPGALDPEAPAGGNYIFCFEDHFPVISDFIRVHNYRQYLNMAQPEPGDIEAYEFASQKQLEEIEHELTGSLNHD